MIIGIGFRKQIQNQLEKAIYFVFVIDVLKIIHFLLQLSLPLSAYDFKKKLQML